MTKRGIPITYDYVAGQKFLNLLAIRSKLTNATKSEQNLCRPWHYNTIALRYFLQSLISDPLAINDWIV